MTEQLVVVDGVQLCLETFGAREDPPLLLIHGLSASMDWWDVELCELLAAQGRYVIRYDHRDTGRSRACPAGQPDYTGDDLRADALRVVDALGIGRAHLVGLSAGGGICQEVAVQHPGRVLSLTLISTAAAGTRADPTALPPPEPRITASLRNPAPEPPWDEPAAVVEHLVEAERLYAGSLGFDEDRVRRVATIAAGRTRDVRASQVNPWAAEQGSQLRFRLADLRVPTLVLHGTADPVFPFAHGRALAAEIPGATLVALEGMGHQTPPPKLWDVVVPAIVRHTGAP